MATTRQFPLHDNLMGGVNTTDPAHLLGAGVWRTQHNMRLTPQLIQIPHKVVSQSFPDQNEPILWLGMLPGEVPGYGQALALTPTKLLRRGETWYAFEDGLVGGDTYTRWSTAIYDDGLYFINEFNRLYRYKRGSAVALANSTPAKYLCFWYGHAVVAALNNHPNRFAISHLYDFTKWDPDVCNEADYYDLEEWDQSDYPFTGITGLGKLHGLLYIYTPTAIIPVQYVGLPKVFRVMDEGIIARTGNTYPWTLVCLDTVHFFYDAIESMFFAFDGQQVQAIGEPVRQYMKDNLHSEVGTAQRMYGYIDADNREIWWPFVSNAQAEDGPYDKAVVFNYRYKKWYTASIENVYSFCRGSRTTSPISSLGTGHIDDLEGSISLLGTEDSGVSRVFGTGTGELLREEDTSDLVAAFVTPYDAPTLETGDFHYGDIRAVKENDLMIINSSAPKIQIRVSARDYLGTAATFSTDPIADWVPTLVDSISNYRALSGRIFRYQFILEDSRLATFDAFSEGLTVVRAER